MAESTCAAKPKRKRTVLSTEDKVAIIKQLEISYNRDKIPRCAKEMTTTKSVTMIFQS